MRRLSLIVIALSLVACGGDDSADPDTPDRTQSASAGGETTAAGDDEFQLSDSDTAGDAHGEHPSEIEANATHAAMRLFVVDPRTGPIEGIVIKLTAPNGRSFYTRPTDSVGYGEVLVPVGQRYQVEYLSLGNRTTRASVQVPEGPNQDIRLTMRYRRQRQLPPENELANEDPPEPEPFVLDGVLFDTGAATIREESFEALDRVVEFMTHYISARIQIAGHTDNVGNPARNQALSEQRAQAVRTYLTEHGIDGARVEAVGYGDTRPVATNDTDEGRAQNRRIEAIEL